MNNDYLKAVIKYWKNKTLKNTKVHILYIILLSETGKEIRYIFNMVYIYAFLMSKWNKIDSNIFILITYDLKPIKMAAKSMLRHFLTYF